MTVPPPVPNTMRAISQDALGGPEVLREVELPRPAPGISQILVAVHAAGVNPTDWKHRARRAFLPAPPFVLGWDVSGVVAAVGFGVTLFQPGDEVFGMLPYPHGAGAHAEYVTGPARAFARKPATLSHVEAGALPLAALTAWQALVDTAQLRFGQRVLIHAAAGGVGHLAVQIAKAAGAYVIGTASEANHDLVRGLGADQVIDYRTTDFAAAVRDVDVVLDPVGGDTAVRSLATLRRKALAGADSDNLPPAPEHNLRRPGGVLVSLLGGPPDLAERAAASGVRQATMLVEADHGGMVAIADLAEAGKLRPRIAGTFPLAEAAKAHSLGEAGHTAGKLVLVVRG
jgi:NADPH:quinone reductase-like Zn-dependent oxidoreductase